MFKFIFLKYDFFMRIVAFIFFLSSLSQASMSPRMQSIMAQLSGTFTETRNTNNQHKMNNKFNVDLLYLVREGPSFGVRYLTEIRNESGFEKGESYGLAIGYYWPTGLHALAYYDFFAKTGDWSNGKGYQFSLGYLEHLGRHYHAGFQLSTKSTTYKTNLANNLLDRRTISDNFASLVLMYLF